jgi:hypothetical protein
MKRLCVIAAAILILGAGQSFGQGRPGMGRPPMERVEQLRKMRLIEYLEMKEEQSVRFMARMNEHEKQRKDLQRQKGESLDRLDQLLEKKADPRELQKVFADIAGYTTRMSEEHQKFFNGLNDILSVEQQAKMLLFERKFERELRDAIREVQRRRPRGAEDEE